MIYHNAGMTTRGLAVLGKPLLIPPVAKPGFGNCGIARQSVVTALAVVMTLVLSSCETRNTGSDALYRQGRDAVRSGDYEAGIAPLTEYLETYPSHRFASQSCLYLGKAYAALGRMSEARTAWERGRDEYPDTLEGHKCRYKLAWLSFIEGDSAAALAGFRAMADNPDGPLAAEAKAFADFLEKGAPKPAESESQE